ncbi:MAG: branched-chain amino acid transport system ATP-binding protein [Actinomycetota bacterium]|jgi:branched-chain amino acid transport system ATP-binding protein|nr:branched-chain amino acid transport system ATP-binding protein [Actinomycetota bacterium]
MTLLEVDSIRVTYGGVVAVRDVSLAVEPGEVVAVLGANGAGKTTTLRAISGLIRARAGTIRLDGDSIVGRSPEAIARLGIAHVPAGRGIFPGLTVAENLRMGLYGASRDSSPDAAGAIEEVLETFPILRERRDQAAGTMSGGQQQQLAIARALVQRPRLLLLDEMSMGLAPSIVADLFALVARLKSQRIGVVMVEQFVGQALQVADRAVVLEQGSVVAAGAPAELSSDDIAAAYLGGSGEPEVTVRPAPVTARERLGVAVRGSDARRLHALALEQGRSVDEVLADLVTAALRDNASLEGRGR